LDSGSNARYANGHLLFLRDGRLMAQRLDLDSLTLQGTAVPIVEGVQMSASGTGTSGGPGAFSAADTGVLIYQPSLAIQTQLAWADSEGRPGALVGQPDDYADVALSPDGTHAAVSALDRQLGTRDLYIVDTVRGSRERFTSEPADDFAPAWSPRGDRLAFTSVRDGMIDIYDRVVSGASTERAHKVAGSPLGRFAASWSPDGRWLLHIAGGRAMARSDLHLLAMDTDGPPVSLLESPAVETQARFSPDGRSVAYVSSASGNLQVYVTPYPGPVVPQRVSTDAEGGGWPHWRKDGRELVFVSIDGATMLAASRDASGRFAEARRLFKVQLRPLGRLDAYQYDVTRDGRFLLNTYAGDPINSSLTLIVNWPSALK
jgi:Tol biopolymer transport system component